MMLVHWPDGILMMMGMIAVIQAMDTRCDVWFSPLHKMQLVNADDWSKMMDRYAT